MGFVGFVIIGFVTLFAPYIAPYDPLQTNYSEIMVAPNAKHPFGTDDLGRDLLSRVLWGGRETLKAGYLAVLIGLGGGTALGLFSGYVGGRVDDIIQRVVEILMAFPSILLLLSIIAAMGPQLTTVIIAIGIA
ncbi:MAG: ABC transporter permease, partial [Anaerolineaceae bacterium]